MTSSNGNRFRVTGPLCGEFTSHWWSPLTKASLTRSFDVLFDLRLNKRLSNRDAGDLRRHRAHYDVTLMSHLYIVVVHLDMWSLRFVYQPAIEVKYFVVQIKLATAPSPMTVFALAFENTALQNDVFRSSRKVTRCPSQTAVVIIDIVVDIQHRIMVDTKLVYALST